MDLIAAQKTFAAATKSTVTITITENGTEVIFARNEPVIGSTQQTITNTVNCKIIDGKFEYQIELEHIRLQLDLLSAQQRKGLNTSKCCIDAVSTRGFRHHGLCPNQVMCV